jgi:hypothetical protein
MIPAAHLLATEFETVPDRHLPGRSRHGELEHGSFLLLVSDDD